jgi:hypothetical protein
VDLTQIIALNVLLGSQTFHYALQNATINAFSVIIRWLAHYAITQEDLPIVNAKKGFMTMDLLGNAKLVTFRVMIAMDQDQRNAWNVEESGSLRMVRDQTVFALWIMKK